MSSESEKPLLIIIVNWNLKEHTAACIRSVHKTGYPCQILVVDNGSQDGSANFITHRFPDVSVLALPHNSGFAAACNTAVHAGVNAQTKYVLLLNNDTIVHQDFFVELISAAEAHPQAGILGPKVYSATDPRRLWHVGARRRRWVLAAVNSGRNQWDDGQFDQMREVDYIFGCAMLIRRAVIESIGVLDTRFFLYLEDMDFCLRAQAAGYRLLLVPQAKMWHHGAASTVQNPGLRKYHLARSTVYFLKKHAARIWFPAAAVFWTLVFLRELSIEFWRGDLDGVRAYVLGLLNG
jgi:GT2 family glycosyltransferase